MKAEMRKLQRALAQITGWCEMAGRWGRRNSWVHLPRCFWNMGQQTMRGRQSLSCSGWRFLSGHGRPKHVWLPPSHFHIQCLSLYTAVVALKSNTFKIHICHFGSLGQSMNNFLANLQRHKPAILPRCTGWSLFHPKGSYYSIGKVLKLIIVLLSYLNARKS